MLVRLVDAAVALEKRMNTSPLHNMHATYLIGTHKGDPTVANYFFRNRNHMEKAKRLETAYAADLITTEQFCDGFPKVFFIAVNAHYSIAPSSVVDTFVSNGISIVRPNLESFLTEMSMELCRGVKVAYVHDDKKFISDAVLGVTVAKSGTVSGVYKTDYQPPFSFRLGTGVLEVFERMETHVRTNGRTT